MPEERGVGVFTALSRRSVVSLGLWLKWEWTLAMTGSICSRTAIGEIERRDAYPFDVDAILKAAAQRKVAMELNAYPDRLDLCDRHLRLANQYRVKIVINTDLHHTSHLDKIRYGVPQAVVPN